MSLPTAPPVLVSTGCCWHLPLEEMLAVPARAGADGIELVCGPERYDDDPDVLGRRVREAAPRRHLHAPFELVTPREALRRRLVRHTARLARAMDAALLVLHPVESADAPLDADLCALTVRALRRALPPECVLTLENLPRSRPPDPLADPGEGRRAVEEIADCARALGLSLTLDSAHLATWGVSAAPVHRRLVDLVAGVHLSDYAAGREHVAPGKGTARLADYLAWVGALDAPPPLTLEIAPENTGSAPLEPTVRTVASAVRFVRRSLRAGW
jgi:sugar phosphate isomerase/epimerase